MSAQPRTTLERLGDMLLATAVVVAAVLLACVAVTGVYLTATLVGLT